ncbi:nucleoside 2-deoxyribosyltransferase [Ornithinibacillus bavariensis]|uniref:nucleoside 2-deoxyribosyltransferase n=1 Tax=Ornithinibacillus bavariensis TaxID=545502 RepID=UPI000ECDF549|nr:group-specific protein [Ornithinibacillus sp.]
MNFYIASGLDNKEIVRRVRDRLIAAGHVHTYDWTKNSRAMSVADLRAIGIAERDAVKASDVILVLLPGGKGTHIELGIGIGLQKKIHLYSDKEIAVNTATTFYYLDQIDYYYGELESFITYIIDLYA